MTRQINSNGQALEEGLDVFISVPFLSNEYLSFNDSFIPSTLSASPIASSGVDYAVESVATAGLPTNSNSDWFRYGSDSETTPVSLDNIIRITSVVSGTSSISGIFQELRQLIVGNEYTITVNFHKTTDIGTFGLSRLYNSSITPYALTQSAVKQYTLPLSSITLDFTATTKSDILFIEFTSTVNGNLTDISSINVQEKSSYQFPVVTNLIGSGVAKVLRRKYNSSVPLEEGQPKPTD